MLVRGRGALVGPGRVEVDGLQLRASHGVVVCTGTSPAVPPIEGLDRVSYWTNREAVLTKTLPRTLVILGGGAIGVELAQAFARFGAAVTVVEGAERLIPAERELSGIMSLSFDEESALQVIRLPPLHRDPFDPMLIPQAIAGNLAIVTPDPLIMQYPVRVIW